MISNLFSKSQVLKHCKYSKKLAMISVRVYKTLTYNLAGILKKE